MQNLKKSWLGKWHQEFSKFSSEHLKMSKLVFSWDSFVHKLTEVELTRCFRIDARNLMNFDSRTRKSQKFIFLMGYFWPHYIILELKKYRGVMFNCTQDWYKVWRKTGLCFQKLTLWIWQIFTRALESLETLSKNS